MAKKPSKTAARKAAAPDMLDSQLASAVRESAQKIWLAGMGAFAKAQAEGGKMFDALVKEGADLQRKTQAAAGERRGDAIARPGKAAKTAKADASAPAAAPQAGNSWGKLEIIFEERTAKALGKLGVPTARDVAELARRVDELSAVVAGLAKAGKAPAKKVAAKRAPARKPAAD